MLTDAGCSAARIWGGAVIILRTRGMQMSISAKKVRNNTTAAANASGLSQRPKEPKEQTCRYGSGKGIGTNRLTNRDGDKRAVTADQWKSACQRRSRPEPPFTWERFPEHWPSQASGWTGTPVAPVPPRGNNWMSRPGDRTVCGSTPDDSTADCRWLVSGAAGH